MHKNVFSYYIGFLLSGILLFIFFGARYPALFFIYGAALLLGTAFFIIVRKSLAPHLDPRILEDKYCNHFLWIYNEEHSALLTNLFISMKFVLIIAFFTLVLIPIKEAVISPFSLFPLSLLALFVCIKACAAKYSFDYSAQYSSWETSLTKDERIYLYKSIAAFLTMAFWPLFICCVYGNSLFKISFSVLILGLLGIASLLFRTTLKIDSADDERKYE